MRLVEDDFRAVVRRHVGDRQVGHEHFWRRALSRRRFIGAALASGAAAGLQVLPPVAEAAQTSVLPNPILGGTSLPFGMRAFYFPTLANPVGSTMVVENGSGDASMIRDFKGSVGLVEFPQGGVVSGDPLGGTVWAADIRFMDGQFVGRDNRKHHGSFAFI
jgi:hypothetical protein